MPTKRKPKIEKIFQGDIPNYIVEPTQITKETETEEKQIILEKPDKENTNNIKKTEVINKDINKDKNYTIILCEKPQAAMKMAYSLADITPVKRNFFGVPYWEINHNEKKYIIASAVGHLYGLKQKTQSKDWPTFDLEWRETESFGRKYINALKSLAKDSSDFILACDYDVEGELIGFNVLRFIFKTETARRMKFSALTKYDLQNSFDSMLEHIDYGQAYAGETRHYLDWFYGINLSRALIESIKSVGAFKILSIGRVQGPALALIVSREKEIQAFKPTPYWQAFLLIQDSKEQRIEVKFPENITSEQEAQKFLKLKGKKGKAETTIEKQSLRPWPPFDLTSLQMESYKFFRFSPAQTLAIAQKLYLQGLISYPRTSSQKLPPSIGYNRILDKLRKLYPKLSQELKRDIPVQGGKTDPAHPAIFPTGEQGKLTIYEKKVYELIVKRFLACFAKDALIENKKIKVTVSEKEFFAEGKQILEQGWLKIYPYKIQETDLPTIEGEIIVKEARIEEKMTEPPRRYSPASIILELEKRKLGTKTTRAMIIDTLYKRGYITGTQIQASSLGLATVNTLEKNSPTILDEQLTREFEEKMDKILEGQDVKKMKQEEQDILQDAKDIIIKISKEFKSKEKEIGQALLEANKELEQHKFESNKLFTCPECQKGTLIMLRGRTGKRFAACNNEQCKKTYALPQFGLIKPSDRKCEKCNRQMLVLIKKSRPPWYFCMNPACWQIKPATELQEKKIKVKKEKKVKKKTNKIKKEKN
jgi:DNA topoisomerase I